LANTSTVLLLIGVVVILGLVVRLLFNKLRQQRLEDERRRLALRVLTHEFRTPVASLLLIVEQLNRRYGDFDEDLQENFLRLSGEIYRLQRLVETSRHYLRADPQKKLMHFNNESLESLKEFLDESLAPYDDVELICPEHPVSWRGDVYWLGIVLKNLVENAFAHGKAPVRVLLEESAKGPVITIEDQGKCEFENLEQMTSEFIKGSSSAGSGLGLNIVNTVIKEMGGELSFLSAPTRFIINLPVNKRTPNEQDFASRRRRDSGHITEEIS
jgi:signal transduction histidine kinase